ncbi:MAG: sporulation integral membrane protein YtvI [Firmicutes bacterium]|nr:sporulation integral membrane protein YtvI [Bacillota bacterium]
MDYESKKKFIVDVLFIVTIAAVILFIFKYMIGWFMPFIVGISLVALMQPLSNLFSRHIQIKNKVASFVSLLILYATIGLILWFGAAFLIDKVADFVTNIPEIYEDHLMPLLLGLNDWTIGIANKFAPDTVDFFTDISNTMVNELASLAADFSTSCLNMLTSQITRLPYYLLTLVFTIMCSVFISLNYTQVKDFLYRQFPEKGQKILSSLKVFIKSKLLRVLKAYILIMFITFVENSIGLGILGVENNIAIAALIAVCDILPVLGSGTVLVPWAVISLVMGDFFMGFGLLVMYVIIVVVRNAIEPKIVGMQIGLHPIVTITAMFAGLKIIGFAGIFVGPLTILFLIHLRNEGYIKLWK